MKNELGISFLFVILSLACKKYSLFFKKKSTFIYFYLFFNLDIFKKFIYHNIVGRLEKPP